MLEVGGRGGGGGGWADLEVFHGIPVMLQEDDGVS